MSIVLADNQDLTRLGLVYALQKMGHTDDVFVVTDKIELAYRSRKTRSQYWFSTIPSSTSTTSRR